MTNGIYCYIDKKTNKVVYVGKDSYIDAHKRHRDHLSPSRYNSQPFNRILQNNPDRYEYEVLKEGNFSENLLKALEIIYIRWYGTFRPKTNHGYNFTIGGDGTSGYKHSQETCKKIGEANKGKKRSQETRKKISEKVSEARNTSGYFRVYKKRNNNCKQGFTWIYRYTENGKRKEISSVDIKKLEKKVKAQGLIWEKI